jgi:hypothetical protein
MIPFLLSIRLILWNPGCPGSSTHHLVLSFHPATPCFQNWAMQARQWLRKSSLPGAASNYVSRTESEIYQSLNSECDVNDDADDNTDDNANNDAANLSDNPHTEAQFQA